MKKSFSFIMAFILAGCSLDPISNIVDECPGNAAEGSLAYIENAETCNAENSTACQLDGKTMNFSYYFESGYCPPEYPRCVKDNIDDKTVYHCEKDMKLICGGENVLECRPENNASEEVICISSHDDKTCGADNCDAENYGGVDCTKSGSRCEKGIDGKYSCVCDNGGLGCGTECIDPSAEETCGANDCNAENFGGEDCGLNDSGQRCRKDENDKYSCECNEGYVLCDGKCINPEINKTHCGASGACTSSEADSPDFKGINCEAGNGSCYDGKCDCGTGYWCTLEGSDTPQCVNPMNDETCNAVLDETTGKCTIFPCLENEVCRSKTDKEFYCEIKSCPETEQKCPEETGYVCYSKYDIHHCGNCSKDCTIMNTETYKAVGCEDNGEGPDCTYECQENTTNCGTPFDPICVDTNTHMHHCGACDKACTTSQYCENGTCVNTECQPNECTTKNESGDQICVNSDDKCGASCMPCKNIHTNGYCQNGSCFISQCHSDEHPIFDESHHITACHKNTNTACAPSNRTSSDPIINCEANKGSNVNTVKCGDAGLCVITSCQNGYHLSPDGNACIENTPAVCGAPTHSSTIDCTTIANAADTACLDNGSCIVTNCAPGYHLSADKRSCVANTQTSCAPTNSNNVENCKAIDNASTTECNNGNCKVISCATDYHPNASYTACEANSDSACGTTTSASIKNCNTTITNSASTKCDAGTCKVTKCATGYHPNTSYTACVINTTTACGTTTSASTKNCNTTISNSATNKCSSGTCKVVKCATGYHPNSAYTGCVANTTSSCASTTSDTTTNCNNIANSVTRACTDGKCTVSKCASGYHLNSDKTGCAANSNTSCGKVNSSSTVNCTSNSYEKVCNSSGVCACTKDGSKVLNYDKNACVIPACSGLPGVKDGTLRTKNFYNYNYSDYACQASACSSGYELYTNGGGTDAKNCKPKSGTCKAGYVNASSCNACCGHNKCSTGYRYYIMACYPKDVCCGTRNADMSKSTDYTCKNCAAQGKTCNLTSGNCE